MRYVFIGTLLTLTSCAAFPESAEQAAVDIRKVVRSIECELAAAAFTDVAMTRDFASWNALTDLDITLEHFIGLDGSAAVTAPYGLAGVSAAPRVGGSGADLRTSSLKFATSIKDAMSKFPTCLGPNPSETNMGLANWIEGSIQAVGPGSLVAMSFTKQFKIKVSGGSRFGYALLPVTNTVVAGAGFDASRDYINRFTIALGPPAGRPKPQLVHVTNWPRGASPNFQPEGLSKGPPETPKGRTQAEPRPRTAPAVDGSPRERAARDPQVQQMLNRQSPVILAPQ